MTKEKIFLKFAKIHMFVTVMRCGVLCVGGESSAFKYLGEFKGMKLAHLRGPILLRNVC